MMALMKMMLDGSTAASREDDLDRRRKAELTGITVIVVSAAHGPGHGRSLDAVKQPRHVLQFALFSIDHSQSIPSCARAIDSTHAETESQSGHQAMTRRLDSAAPIHQLR
ncbi:hypothetical protein TgHK011_001186 [Trichoderma gracile]|nr:hypothetical protein TgHK011_001186 [Trichoderma gracile]